MVKTFKVGYLLSGIVVLLFLLSLFLPNILVEKDSLLLTAERELARITGLNVKITGVSIAAIPKPRIQFSEVVLKAPGDEPARPLVYTQRMTLSLGAIPLLLGKATVNSVKIENPTVRFYKGKEGKWNYSSLSSTVMKIDPPSVGTSHQVRTLIESVVVTGGRLELHDSEYSFLNRSLVLENVDARLDIRGIDRPMELTANINPVGRGKPLRIAGEIGPMDPDDLAETSLNLSLRGNRVQLADYRSLLNDPQFEISGTVSTFGTFKGSFLDGVQFNQQAAYDDLRISTKNGILLLSDFSAQLEQKGILQPTNKTVLLDNFTVKNDGFELNAIGSVRHKGFLPVMDLEITSGWTDLKTASIYVPGFDKAFNSKGHLDFSGKLKGVPGRDLFADIKFEAESIEMERGSLLLDEDDNEKILRIPGSKDRETVFPALPLSIRAEVEVNKGRFEWIEFANLKARASLKDYWISLDEMRFDAFGGTVSGAAWLNLHELPPAYGNDVIVRDMEIDHFLTAFAGLKGVMSGKASTKLYVSGQGTSMAQFKETTTGVGQVRISSGQYTPVNFLGEVLEVVALPRPETMDPETRFDRMNAYLVVKDGKLDFRELRCRSKDWTLEGEGYIGMDQAMSLKYVMTLSDSMASIVTGGDTSRVQLSPEGQLQFPFALSGTFTQPVFSTRKEMSGASSPLEVSVPSPLMANIAVE